jgi:hypothetical protein
MDTIHDTDPHSRPRGRVALIGGGMAAGLLAGGVLMGALTASADTTSTPPTESGPAGSTTQAPATPPPPRDESQPQRSDETLLTGDTADKVKAAALAKYPGATVLRVETDADGVYEAHLTKADGTRVTVEVDKSFTVTGDEAMPPGGPHGPQGPPPPPGATSSPSTTSTSA